jgi:hypothetical protein
MNCTPEFKSKTVVVSGSTIITPLISLLLLLINYHPSIQSFILTIFLFLRYVQKILHPLFYLIFSKNLLNLARLPLVYRLVF